MGRKQAGKHCWSLMSDHVAPSGQLRSLFRCTSCGVEVDTPGGFPASRHYERWDGQKVARYQPRPQCN